MKREEVSSGVRGQPGEDPKYQEMCHEWRIQSQSLRGDGNAKLSLMGEVTERRAVSQDWRRQLRNKRVDSEVCEQTSWGTLLRKEMKTFLSGVTSHTVFAVDKKQNWIGSEGGGGRGMAEYLLGKHEATTVFLVLWYVMSEVVKSMLLLETPWLSPNSVSSPYTAVNCVQAPHLEVWDTPPPPADNVVEYVSTTSRCATSGKPHCKCVCKYWSQPPQEKEGRVWLSAAPSHMTLH